MPRMLKNAQITHVSYVDKGANKKTFFLTKSEEQPTFQNEVKLIAKEEGEQKLVYGVVYEPNIEDAHGDAMDAEEIEKAAHYFMKEARNIDKQHDFTTGVGEVVESYVAPADIELDGQTIQKGSWVLVTKASDEVWTAIQKGEITGYSMAGTAEVEEIKKSEDTQFKKFFAMAKEFFTSHSNKTNSIQKEEELDMTPEQLTEIVKSAMAPLEEKLTALEKAQEEVKEAEKTEEEKAAEEAEVKKAEEAKQAEEVQKAEAQAKAFEAVLEKALAPLQERLETVEKSRDVTKSLDTETIEKSKKTEGVFDSLFQVSRSN